MNEENMDENSKPINPLPDDQLRDRMNFTKMMARQENQIKQTPHIKNLINPLSGDSHSELKSRIEKLEDHYNMKAIIQRFDLLDENLAKKRIFKLDLNITNKRQTYYIGALSILCAIIFGSFSKADTITKFQEQIVYKDTIQAKTYFMTKYVNIRTHSSTTAKKLTTLAPNSIVEILEVQKDWKKVKYVDHVNNRVLIGWAYGENLRPTAK